MTYDGVDGDPDTLASRGLGGISLGDTMTVAVRVLDHIDRESIEITVEVFSDAGRVSRFSATNKDLWGIYCRPEDFPVNRLGFECDKEITGQYWYRINEVVSIPVSEFKAVGTDGGADFNDVGAIRITSRALSPGADMTLPVVSFSGGSVPPPDPEPPVNDTLCENIAFVCSLPAVQLSTCFGLVQEAGKLGIVCTL